MRRKHRVLARATCIAALAAWHGAAADVRPPTRSFGLTVGDSLEQRIELTAAPTEMPATGRLDRWLERLPVADAVEEGGGTLVLRYRVVNSPEEPIVADLPALTLALADGTSVEVPAWPISIVPLAPVVVPDAGGLPAVRPDRLTAGPSLAAPERRLRIALVALAIVLLGWAGWYAWRRSRDAVRLPFALAAARLAALPRRDRDEHPAAWEALHRAMDRTAGSTVHAGSVDALLRAAPWLEPWAGRIAGFYAASTARFFAQPPRADASGAFDVGALCTELARAERGHAA